MRGADDFFIAEQRMLFGGLFRKNVQSRARNLTRVQPRLQIRFDDQTAARAIDDIDAFLAFCQRCGVDDGARLICQRRMERNEIRAVEQLIQFDFFNAQFFGAFDRRRRLSSSAPKRVLQRSNRYSRIR